MSDGGGEEKKGDGGQHQHPPQPYYGTFQGVPAYTSQEPVIGFPQPAPPPGAFSSAAPSSYPHGYQAVPGQLANPSPSTFHLLLLFIKILIASNCMALFYVPLD